MLANSKRVWWKVLVHLTRNDPMKCGLCLVATGSLHINWCDNHDNYKALTALIRVVFW